MSINEANELFKAFADIERSLDRAKNNSSSSALWQNALSLIEEHTKNVKWRDEVASQFSGPANDTWKTSILDELSPTLMRANQLPDRVMQGVVYMRCGYYNEAQQAFSDSSELYSHLNVFLKNWTYITCMKGSGSVDLLLNSALAHWALGEYRSCLATLLQLDIADATKAQTVWLTPAEVRSMLIYSIFLGSTREELRHFANTDILAEIMDVQPFLTLFESMELQKFWDEVRKLPLPLPTLPTIIAALSDRINQEWLFAYTKVPIALVRHTFRLATGGDYSELDLIEDLERWGAPYKLDLEKEYLEFSPHPIKGDTNAIAQELANEYMRNVTLLAWTKHNDSTYII